MEIRRVRERASRSRILPPTCPSFSPGSRRGRSKAEEEEEEKEAERRRVAVVVMTRVARMVAAKWRSEEGRKKRRKESV